MPAPPFSLPNSYYSALVTSQYRDGAPNLLAWLAANLQLMQDVAACLTQLRTAFDIRSAAGAQLDVLGAIVGQPRTVPFQPTPFIVSFTPFVGAGGTGYTAGDVVTVVQPGASGAQLTVSAVSGGVVTALAPLAGGYRYQSASGLSTTGGTGAGLTVTLIIITTVVSPVLDDAIYRILLQARVLANHWDGKIDSLKDPWDIIFPLNSIAIEDFQDMRALVTMASALPQILIDLIVEDYIVPRPAGVEYIFNALTPL